MVSKLNWISVPLELRVYRGMDEESGPSGKFEMETLNIVNLRSKKGTNGLH